MYIFQELHIYRYMYYRDIQHKINVDKTCPRGVEHKLL